MRATYEKIIPVEQTSFTCLALRGERFSAPLHFHPEYELTLILAGRGLRFAGDSIEAFGPGDFVLLGPDLPHFWRSDLTDRPRAGDARAVCVQFRADFAGRGWRELPEFAAVGRLLARSGRGLCFANGEAEQAAARLAGLPALQGAARLLALLGVLDALAGAGAGARELTTEGFAPVLNQADAVRLNRVLDYVQRHLTAQVTQPAAARAAHLSAAGFSRFFRQKTGRTFVGFVNTLRVGHAARLLIEGKGSITEACFASGFQNVSNFNRQFRALKGVSPREFVRRVEGEGK